MTKRIPRSDESLINALKNHLALLEEYSQRAFNQNDLKYCGEVAGKLRVLVLRSRLNTPLLLDLMEKYQIQVNVTLNFEETTITMDEYLDRLAYAIRVKEHGMVEVSNRQLVGLWAQQYGASHEDWELDIDLAAGLNSDIYIGGLQATVRVLRAISNTVLSVGSEFLKTLDNQHE